MGTSKRDSGETPSDNRGPTQRHIESRYCVGHRDYLRTIRARVGFAGHRLWGRFVSGGDYEPAGDGVAVVRLVRGDGFEVFGAGVRSGDVVEL